MHDNPKNAAVLWTGGKDSAMALFEAEQQGYNVQCLVTFAPPNPSFIAHPLAFIKLQAQVLGRTHYVLTVTAPFDKSYEAGLYWLRSQLGIHCVVTGDIAAINAQPNWIRERGRAVGIEVYTPLWGRKRSVLLEQLVGRGFKTYFSLVQTSLLSKDWVGRELDSHAIGELKIISAKNGLDLCGENGEYHTLVTNGPSFASRIIVRSHSVRTTASAAYMEFQKVETGVDVAA